MHQLTIIIVNYNVRHFLEQCLFTVRAAMRGIDGEIWVVDNASSDGSAEALRPIFEDVRWIANQENVGFGRANNQALALATGRYVLFLNPDTLLPEDCLQKCISFMDATEDAGALGVRMVDGSGQFLPESKRAYPSPITSLFKLLGLSALFPQSKVFARYHLGHLSPQQNHEADVLAGAFMLIRKTVLDRIGGFDEQFFMYGEDVDLSYRIQQATLPNSDSTYRNYYFADAPIIHFKGESTKKGSLNYVKMFYQAMALFVKKHYGKGRAGFFTFFIYIAIWLRAGVTTVTQLVRRIGLPLMDSMVTLFCLFGLAFIWFKYVRPEYGLLPIIAQWAIPLFVLVFIGTGALAGLYSRHYRPVRAIGAMLVAMLVVLAIYSLLPEAYRFSRGIIFTGGLLATTVIFLLRKLLLNAGWLILDSEADEHRQTLVAGNADDYLGIQQLMADYGRQNRLLGRLAIESGGKEALMPLSDWVQMPDSLPVREVIFCISESLPLHKVLPMLNPDAGVRYKFHNRNSESVVGSESSNYAGETLGAPWKYALGNPEMKNHKRMLDMALALALLVTWPIQCFIVKNPMGLLSNCIKVLTGKYSWIGYCGAASRLPFIKPGILHCNSKPESYNKALSPETKQVLDERYAADYNLFWDLYLVRKGWKWLGANPQLQAPKA